MIDKVGCQNVHSKNTLPGFIMLFGSRVAFSCFITWMPTSPSSFSSTILLPRPTPCSPVHVPPTANDRLYITKFS